MSKTFDKVGAVNAAYRVGLAQATADQVQDQIEETVALAAEVAEQSEEALTAASQALTTAQEALQVANTVSGLSPEVIEQLLELLASGGGGGGGLAGVQRVGPGFGHWGLTNQEMVSLIAAPAVAKHRWLAGVNRGDVDPATGIYYAFYDYVMKRADLAEETTLADQIIPDWTPSNNLYRNVAALRVEGTPIGSITVLIGAGRQAEDPFTIAAVVLGVPVPTTFAAITMPEPADFAYIHRAILAGTASVLVPYLGDRFIFAGPSGGLDPFFSSAAQELDTSGLGLVGTPTELLMSQGALIPGSSTILTTCWFDEAPLRGALVRVEATTGAPDFVRGGELRIYDDSGAQVGLRTFGPSDIVRLVSDMSNETTTLPPGSVPYTFVDSHRDAVWNPAIGAVVLVPASDRHVYLIFYDEATGTADVERHPLTGVGQLERPYKWGCGVYVPERESVVCAPACHTHVIEIAGAGSTFQTRSVARLPAPASEDAILCSDIVYRNETIYLFPREASTSRIITLPAVFDPAEPYLVTL
jgi:hypothetical protein